jgi:hypothetical protein
MLARAGQATLHAHQWPAATPDRAEENGHGGTPLNP